MSVEKLLTELTNISNSKTLKVLLLNKQFCNFKHISVLQQKNIIECFEKDYITSAKLLNAFNTIVATNVIPSTPLNIFDREIALAALNNTDKVDEINDVISAISVENTKTLKYEGLTVKLHVPSINIDTLINNYFIGRANADTPGKNGSLYFSLETVRFIKSIDVNGISVEFDDFSKTATPQYEQIVSAFSNDVNNDIIEFSNEGKSKIKDALNSINIGTQTPLF